MIAQLHTPKEAASWLSHRVTGNLYADSRNVKAGDGFIAWAGAAQDARQYIAGALNAGANACLVESNGVETFGFVSDKIAAYAGLKGASGLIANAYFKEPSKYLQTVAVTGTNGKTSTAWYLAHALGRLNRRCGMVGTLGVGAPEKLVFNGLTTPDPVLLQQQLRRFVDEGFAACAIEASSIGIVEQRLEATCFQVAIFTNFTQDHLDYHGSMENYWAAKASLFNRPDLKSAVINIDDTKGLDLSVQLKDSSLDVWTVAINRSARLQAKSIEQKSAALLFEVVEGSQRKAVSTHAMGLYSVLNLLGVIGAMRALGISLDDATRACCDLPAVPGRFNILDEHGMPLVVIDYAHTPDAIEKVLSALKPLAHARGGQLWCVFGCGGDRDASKRPLMAASAQTYADEVVVTSDNPRSEDPADIIRQILLGSIDDKSVTVQADRAAAIAQTIACAKPQDVVLVAGKGHENHQEIGGVKHPFEDMAHANAAVNRRRMGGRAA